MSKDSSIRDYRDRPYFFDKGIRFQCQRCGMCCTGEPGIVYADKDEISLMAAFLEIPRQVLEERFLNPFRKGFTIREAEEGRCIFYENGCAVYSVRPLQCRTFPFWFQNMRSPKAWGEACLVCPGIDRGRLYTKDEILLSIHESYPIFLIVMEGAIGLR